MMTKLAVSSAVDLADSIIAEIETSEELLSCKSFSELHDHCDANMLGRTSEVLEDLGDEAIAVINTAQNIVNHWLKTR